MTDLSNQHDPLDTVKKEHRALALLKLLQNDPGYRLNDQIILACFQRLALALTVSDIRQCAEILEAKGLIKINSVNEPQVFELTNDGEDVALGRSVVEGVLRLLIAKVSQREWGSISHSIQPRCGGYYFIPQPFVSRIIRVFFVPHLRNIDCGHIDRHFLCDQTKGLKKWTCQPLWNCMKEFRGSNSSKRACKVLTEFLYVSRKIMLFEHNISIASRVNTP